jgi:hypothetical protein
MLVITISIIVVVMSEERCGDGKICGMVIDGQNILQTSEARNGDINRWII